MAKLTKRQKAIAEKVEAGKAYNFEEAAKLLAELSTVKFTESFDISVNLGVDPRKSDQVVRGATVLPNGTGKTVRVAVFTQGPAAEAARGEGHAARQRPARGRRPGVRRRAHPRPGPRRPPRARIARRRTRRCPALQAPGIVQIALRCRPSSWSGRTSQLEERHLRSLPAGGGRSPTGFTNTLRRCQSGDKTT